MAFWTNGAPVWNSLDDNTRAPLTSELESGYPCGEADQQLFNWTAGYSINNIAYAINNLGMTWDADDVSQLYKAIAAPRTPINLQPSGGQASILATDHRRYFIRDVFTNGGYALPTTASTPVGTEFIVRMDGNPVSLPLPAVTVTGGGSINLNGTAHTSLTTFGRGEVIRFRRVGAGYDAEVLKNSEQCYLIATSNVSTFINGAAAYTPIPAMNVVSGTAYQTFGLASGVATIPVTGSYWVQLAGQFNANGGTGGGGIVIGPSPFSSIAAAQNYCYADIATSFSQRLLANLTSRYQQGFVVEFDYALTNAQSRIRPQDFGVNILYLGR